MLALAACASTGSGYGAVREGGAPVRFEWKSADDVSGTLSATLADGKVFTGQYFQVTGDVRLDRLTPLWDGWRRPWDLSTPRWQDH